MRAPATSQCAAPMWAQPNTHQQPANCEYSRRQIRNGKMFKLDENTRIYETVAYENMHFREMNKMLDETRTIVQQITAEIEWVHEHNVETVIPGPYCY